MTAHAQFPDGHLLPAKGEHRRPGRSSSSLSVRAAQATTTHQPLTPQQRAAIRTLAHDALVAAAARRKAET
jgi:hypothetical protein